MSFWRIAWRSIQQRSVASALTAVSMSLGVALVVAVLVIHGVVDKSFRRGSQGYDLIVGAKGSPLQLVLNTVFHLSQPIENIPYSYYDKFTEGDFSPAVETAIPVCMGHEYRGFATVATVPEMFEKLTYLDGRKYEFAKGRNFQNENPFEAVVGATAAQRAGLKLGDTFKPTDSVGEAPAHAGHDDLHKPITIVGVLAPTGTPTDRAIFMNMEGFYRFGCHTAKPTAAQRVLSGVGKSEKKPDAPQPDKKTNPAEKDAQSGSKTVPAEKDAPPDKKTDLAEKDADHDHEHDDHEGNAHRQITAILVCTDMTRPGMAMTLPDVINKENIAQAVAPSRVIAELFDGIVGNVQLLLLIIAILVVIVAGVGILVSIYNSMSDRKHEIAVMRALGASRAAVMTIIFLESILLSLGGGAVGLLLGHGLIGILGPTIVAQTGVAVGPLQFRLIELILIPGLIALATLVGFLPAMAAYRTDVAKSLSANP